MGHGHFSGEPEAVWLTEADSPDRKMKIVRDFFYVDPSEETWSALKGSLVDGASIPRALWTIVGAPYAGDYRRASIVHDVACEEAGDNQTKRRAADRMFYHACRAGDCSIWQSILLYIGVRIGAAARDVPAWYPATMMESTGPRIARIKEEKTLESDFQTIVDYVMSRGEVDDPVVLEERVDEALRAIVAREAVGSHSRGVESGA